MQIFSELVYEDEVAQQSNFSLIKFSRLSPILKKKGFCQIVFLEIISKIEGFDNLVFEQEFILKRNFLNSTNVFILCSNQISFDGFLQFNCKDLGYFTVQQEILSILQAYFNFKLLCIY
eukprot:TRINITY_DN33016_c0_g1_i1.p3 TRINITY_DN33016_c0_g1~~TRINITY_DN33016_c0_g1_i1.p3  ORF type:complete len:119 (+),score=1.19 TRINITY_DN33016_c0_g1_i1:123-479(+)